ncbi:MAG TPA: radical SAM protein [Spirochaetota bacterium]|nr:radical SAM protein [Spirochaetota bacterium]
MSSLALQALYDKVNSCQNIQTGRFFINDDNFFCPENIHISNIDIAFVTSSYEMDILNLLKIKHKLQEYKIPSVLGGINAHLNPSFFAKNFDIIFLGRLDKRFDLIMQHFLKYGPQRLTELKLPGIFHYSLGRCSNKESPAKDYSYLPSTVITSSATVFPNTFLTEIAAGCRHKCRFCLLSSLNKPYKYYPSSPLLAKIKKLPLSVKQVGLVAASVNDYPHIENLIKAINRFGKKITTASLRMENITPDLLTLLKANEQKTITLAPETAAVHLQKKIGKIYREKKLLQTAELIASYGFARLKLYYLIGLPAESDNDIILMTEQIKKIKNALNKGAARSGINPLLELSINPFIPKPFTKLGAENYENVKTLKQKIKLVKKKTAGAGNIKLHFLSPRAGKLQYFISNKLNTIADILEHAAVHKYKLMDIEKKIRNF